MTAVVAVLSSLSIIVIYVLNSKTKFSLPLYAFVVDSNNLLPTALGISLFMLFMNLKNRAEQADKYRGLHNVRRASYPYKRAGTRLALVRLVQVCGELHKVPVIGRLYDRRSGARFRRMLRHRLSKNKADRATVFQADG